MTTDGPTKVARPAPAAARLLWPLAAAQFIPIGLALMVYGGGIQDQIVRALDNNPEPLGGAGAFVVVVGATLAGFVGLVAAILTMVLAPKVGRGSGPARTTAWVVGAALLLWSGVVTAINPAGGPLTLLAPAADTNNTLSGKQFQEQLNAALPGWVEPANLGFTALTAVLVIALFVALARSARAS